MKQNDPAVRRLQTYLRLIGAHEDGITQPPIDGIFDTATERSVSDYQAKRGLPVTGEVDGELWEMIYAEYCALSKTDCAALPVPLFPCTPNAVLRAGMRDFSVAAARHLLSELHNSHASIPILPLSDEYDEKTADAVRCFQCLYRLPETGEIDRTTWDLLVGESARLE